MNSNNIIPEINIKDLLYVLLKKIWIMILMGAILGAAFSGYKLSQRVLTYDILDTSTKLNTLESDAQYQQRVTNIYKARGYVEMISRVNTQIEHQRQYVSDSVYMQINAEHEFQTSAQISITLSNSNAIGTESILISSYEREIRAGHFLDEYAQKINVDPEYIKEVILFGSFVPDNQFYNNDLANNRIASLNIAVIGPSREFCDEIMNLIIDFVYSIHSDLNDTVSTHQISVVGMQHIEKIDEELRTEQNNQIARIDGLQKQIVSYNDSLDRIAKELGVEGRSSLIDYFDTHPEEQVFGIPDDTSERYESISIMIKPGIKNGVVGFVLGFVIVAVCIVYKYIFGKTFNTQNRFFSEFSCVRKIGVLKPSIKRSKFCQFIDIKSEDDTNLSLENNNRFINRYYNALSKKYNKILITGVANKEDLKAAVNMLDIKGDLKPDMFNNPDVLNELSEYDAVVLIEKRNSSLFKSVYNEINILCNSGVVIIGAIII